MNIFLCRRCIAQHTGERMNELVYLKNNEAVCDSLQVAEKFGKRHDKLVSEIERMYSDLIGIGCDQNGGDPMFIKSSYIHPQNKQIYPMYIMNRDGFSLLVMGFTGKKALEWKRIMKARYKRIVVFQEIKNVIEQLPSADEREVMSCRYIQLNGCKEKSWEEVCVITGHEWAQTHRIHSKALKNIHVPKKEDIE